MGGIDLDPASNPTAQLTVKATKYYTKEDDGLAHEWHGHVWLNPPYARGLIDRFVYKLIGSHEVTEAIMLTNASTDTAWFHAAATASTALCITRGRIKFLTPDGIKGSPPNGQAFFYYGANPKKFAHAFKDVGLVVYT